MTRLLHAHCLLYTFDCIYKSAINSFTCVHFLCVSHNINNSFTNTMTFCIELMSLTLYKKC